MDATIVIPVKNGGDRLKKVLEAIKTQKTDYKYETVIVDSGSSDGSQEIGRAFTKLYFEISPEDFGHGKTRNYGASKGSGRYIIFLTQDATPADSTWLDEMISAMDESKAAGGFGKHLPYPDCNMVDQKLLYFHFLRFGDDGAKYYDFKLDDANKERYQNDSDYEQLLTFFSDNCSILRREIWEKYPYKDVNFAEDQVWAKEILEAGFTKIYIPGARVYHSHNYPLKEYGKRYFDDFKAMYSVHNYNMCPNFSAFMKLWLKNSLSECKYVLKRKDLGVGTKIYWCIYGFRRHYIRNKASQSAVKYFSMSKEEQRKLDEKYSQQLRQRTH